MRIESAINASREGINTQGQAIAVISDNISNSNTTAYKESRAEFSDIYASFTGAKDDGPIQDGSGSKISGVRSIFTSSTAEFTGRSLDMAIEGNGFFITGDATASSGSLQYTRAGNFQLDKEGYLTTAGGQYVLGTTGTTTTAAGASPTLSRINLTSVQTGATATSKVGLSGNLSSTLPTVAAPGTFATMNALGQAASHIESIQVYDSLGTAKNLTLGYFKTAANTWTVNAYAEGSTVGGAAGSAVQVGTSTITFGTDGKIPTASQAAAKLTATPAWANGAAAGNFTIDLSQYTQFASGSALSGNTQDGSGVGQVKSYELQKDGKILAGLSNGAFAQVGTVQLANFTNVDGLQRIGSNSYQATAASGKITIGAPGTSGLGDSKGSALEQSSTDLSSEFVNLVVFQRGYQANSKALNAAMDIISQTLGLIR